MSTLHTVAIVLHHLFAAVLVGSVAFVTLAVLPLARDAVLGPAPLETVVDRVRTVSRLSALVLLASGLFVLYTVTLDGALVADPLVETGRGHLVLTMITLWAGLIGAVEIGSSKLLDGLAANKHREPAHVALPWFRGATALAVLVSVVGGLLSAGVTY